MQDLEQAIVYGEEVDLSREDGEEEEIPAPDTDINLTCNLCDKSFNKHSLLKKHMKSHLGKSKTIQLTINKIGSRFEVLHFRHINT